MIITIILLFIVCARTLARLSIYAVIFPWILHVQKVLVILELAAMVAVANLER